jgi:hypothetical protein
MTSKKFDQGKDQLSYLLEIPAFDELVKVLMLGEAKYGRNNFRETGFAYSRLMDAALRHMRAFQRGEAINVESLPDGSERRVHHLACAAVNLVFLLNQELGGYGSDDRWVDPRLEEEKE